MVPHFVVILNIFSQCWSCIFLFRSFGRFLIWPEVDGHFLLHNSMDKSRKFLFIRVIKMDGHEYGRSWNAQTFWLFGTSTFIILVPSILLRSYTKIVHLERVESSTLTSTLSGDRPFSQKYYSEKISFSFQIKFNFWIRLWF